MRETQPLTQQQLNDLFDRKMAATQLLLRMQKLKNHKGKAYKQCQEAMWRLVHPHGDKTEEAPDEVDKNALQKQN